MSGIYIKGMEMPKGVRPCPFASMDENWKMVCIVGGKHQWHKDRRCDDCPLIEVPEHGRLIDERDAYDKIAEEAGEESGNYVDMDVVGRGLECTHTVIPADKEE